MPTKTKTRAKPLAPPQPPPAALATAEAAADIADLATLAAAIASLSRRTPVVRAKGAKALMVAAQRLLADAHREAVYEATRDRRYGEVAADLGVSPASVALAVTNHHKAHPELKEAQ